MELQTSFIPKRTLDTSPVRRADTVSIFTVLSTLIFFASIITAGGVFLWQKQIQSEITKVENQIQTQKKEFSEDKIKEFTSLSNRINAADSLFVNHIYTSKIFELLQKNTVPTVRFNKFTVDPSQTDKQSLKITLNGQAKDYASIALQSYVFAKSQNIVSSYEFSNLTLDQAGNVLFDLSATIEKRVAAFESNIQTADISDIAPQSQETSAELVNIEQESNPFPQ